MLNSFLVVFVLLKKGKQDRILEKTRYSVGLCVKPLFLDQYYKHSSSAPFFLYLKDKLFGHVEPLTTNLFLLIQISKYG